MSRAHSGLVGGGRFRGVTFVIAAAALFLETSGAVVRPRGIHLVAYTNKVNRGFCCTTASALHQHWEPEFTASLPDYDASDAANGKVLKVAFWESLANAFPPDDILWIVDAWDMLVQHGPRYVEEVYERLERHHGHRGVVVVSAEANCWPFVQDQELWTRVKEPRCGLTCDGLAPKNLSYLAGGTTHYNFLNSGSILTRAGSLPGLVDYVQRVWQECPETRDDDQAVMAAANFLQDKMESNVTIRLDHDGLIAASTQELCKSGFHLESDSEGQMLRRKWQNRMNDVVPAAVHFNGDKSCLLSMYRHGEMPWEQHGHFMMDGKEHDMVEACGTEVCQVGAIANHRHASKDDFVNLWIKSKPEGSTWEPEP